ncbi:hypothetical protein Pfo_021159 [Paulownia fortunei]|nr:hypothetical protein Pfo_021159 [Paulownia fortunei]
MLDPPTELRNPRVESGVDRAPNLVHIRNHGRGRRRHRDLEEAGIRSWFQPRRRNSLFDEDNDDWGPESGILARPRTWIILRPTGPTPAGPNLPRERPVPPGVDPRNYFTGAGIQELIEELTQNDRPAHHQHQIQQSTPFQQLKLHQPIWKRTRSAQFARKNSKLEWKRGSSHAIMSTIQIASFHG